VARNRLATLETQLDPASIRYLEGLGIGEGWQCLEVGGGGGSLTEWFSRQVGPAGRVVATDINTPFLEALDFANLDVRVHNIIEDQLEQGAFDLVHARGVLVHLSQRDTVLERMVSALKPGGLVLVEEPDNRSFVADPRAGPALCELFAMLLLIAIQVATGIDAEYGGRLYADVCVFGLVDVGAEGRAVFGRGGGTPEA
jgi:2-polyprenyl-3-methyl-5-hydroxy-6-metoxy-1,4-benzoquinol methylase